MDKYKLLYESLCKAQTALENRNIALASENEFLKQNCNNADRAADIAKQNMRNALTDYNSKEQEYIKEIQLLRGKLKEMNCGNID